MEVELFNILKTGNQEKLLVRKQEFQQRRTLIAVDPYNEVMWIFHGTEVDPEIIRVTRFALDDLKEKHKDLKLKQVIVDRVEYNERSHYLIGLHKNPGLAMAGGKVKVEESKEVKAKVLSGGAASGIPKVAIAVTDSNSKKMVPKADIHEGKVVMTEDFQITYYEGGRIVLDDLEEHLAEGKNHQLLISHIGLINRLVKEEATLAEASSELTNSLTELMEELFPEKKAKKAPAKKASKKVVEEEKEEVEKPAKKSTKKAKKTTKKANKSPKKEDEVEEKPAKKSVKKTTKKAKKTTKKAKK